MSAREAAGRGRGASSRDRSGTGRAGSGRAWLRRDGKRFFARRKSVLARITAWSLVESAQTFLGGYCLAQALDRGFLAGRAGTGAAWLALAALAILAGGPVARGVFTQLAALVEPFRDALVRRAVDQALHRAVGGRDGTGSGRDGTTGSGSAVSRVAQQSEIARDSFAGLVLTARSFVFTAVGALAGLFALAPELLVVTAPPLVLGLGLFLATLRPMADAQRAFLDAEEEFTDRTRAAGAGLRDVVACGVQAEVGARAAGAAQAAERAAGVLARWSAVRVLALGVAGQLPPVLLLVAVPWLLDRGLTAGALTGALTYLVQSLLPALHTLMTALGAAGTRLLVVLDRFTHETEAAGPPTGGASSPSDVAGDAGRPRTAEPSRTAAPSRTAEPSPAAELRAVGLAYGPGARPVLDGLHLTVGPGEHLAVVGPSGIGKSTLANVLAGLLPPDRGTALIGGRCVRGRPPAELALLRALVPQEAYVFTASVRDNLTHLRPGATDAEVAETVAALHLGPLIDRLGGQDALLVPSELSQGERQLLTLARAHLSPAPLLVLDEATCHLDQETEDRVERALAARPGALVVVAHRMSSALRADRVLVLDGIRADCGTHRELLERSALYRNLTGHWHDEGTHRAADGTAAAS
ncbi:ATP-binding cassette domain-containing protein [Streptomyces sp. NPDC021093]|uniref:ATP-binding cassette domain-containing protein n=1 Tax=Streptomyces sp. NPDC021093 TaxID=3365112 RepID=UPI0037AE4D1B